MVRGQSLPPIKQTVWIKEWQTYICFNHAMGRITFKLKPFRRVQCFYIWLQFGILVPYYKQLYNSLYNPLLPEQGDSIVACIRGVLVLNLAWSTRRLQVLDLFLGPSREHKKSYHDCFLPHPSLFVVLYRPVFRQFVNWPADIFFSFSTHKNIDIIFISLIDQNLWC